MLRVKPRTIYDWVSQRRIPFRKGRGPYMLEDLYFATARDLGVVGFFRGHGGQLFFLLDLDVDHTRMSQLPRVLVVTAILEAKPRTTLHEISRGSYD